jgi:hypothetical protein
MYVCMYVQALCLLWEKALERENKARTRSEESDDDEASDCGIASCKRHDSCRDQASVSAIPSYAMSLEPHQDGHAAQGAAGRGGGGGGGGGRGQRGFHAASGGKAAARGGGGQGGGGGGGGGERIRILQGIRVEASQFFDDGVEQGGENQRPSYFCCNYIYVDVEMLWCARGGASALLFLSQAEIRESLLPSKLAV